MASIGDFEFFFQTELWKWMKKMWEENRHLPGCIYESKLIWKRKTCRFGCQIQIHTQAQLETHTHTEARTHTNETFGISYSTKMFFCAARKECRKNGEKNHETQHKTLRKKVTKSPNFFLLAVFLLLLLLVFLFLRVTNGPLRQLLVAVGLIRHPST